MSLESLPAATRDRLEELIDEKNRATQKLEEEIFMAMVAVAKQHHIDAMDFTGWDERYTRRGKRVECAELDDLSRMYSAHIHTPGFQAAWRADSSWL